jgi:N-acetylglucosamine kinase-like BadF-type ATPase
MKAVGPAAAHAEIDRAVAQAFTSAGRSRGPVAAACLGLAGAGRPDDQAAVRAWAARIELAAAIEVVGDVALPVALLPHGFGVAVVAGTGSCVLGRAADGRTARSGGWGPLLGDEGSGYALVLDALKAVALAADRRGPATTLTGRLLARMGLGEPARLIPAVHGPDWDRSRLSELAVNVIRAADEGDVVAGAIVARHCEVLAACVAAVLTDLGLPRAGWSLALAGGLLVQAPTYRDRLLLRLSAIGLRPADVLAVSEPAEGAVRLAVSLAGASG